MGGCAASDPSAIRVGPLPRAELAFESADSEVPAGTTPVLVYLSGTPTSSAIAPDYGYAIVMDGKSYQYHDVLLGKKLGAMKVSVAGNPYLIDVLPRIDPDGNLWLPHEGRIGLTLHDGDNPAPGTAWRKVEHPTKKQAAWAAKRLRQAVDGIMGRCWRDEYGIRSLTNRNIDALMKRNGGENGRR